MCYPSRTCRRLSQSNSEAGLAAAQNARKPHKLVIVAIARRLAAIANAILKIRHTLASKAEHLDTDARLHRNGTPCRRKKCLSASLPLTKGPVELEYGFKISWGKRHKAADRSNGLRRYSHDRWTRLGDLKLSLQGADSKFHGQSPLQHRKIGRSREDAPAL